MFSLGDGTRFSLYSKPTDMRKGFNMLGGGYVFVFVNASNYMMKLLRYEPGGCILCSERRKAVRR